ncbi:MAG: hypothetical protein ASARMPREDX12_000039 [Alectoria sarmentosa]|nr:MAG: hypothetical protein ASARMPREDX12_000039 [Alectoria sarmentosa]
MWTASTTRFALDLVRIASGTINTAACHWQSDMKISQTWNIGASTLQSAWRTKYLLGKKPRGRRESDKNFPSKLAKRKAAVAGGAGSNQEPRGQVRKNEHGVLEYWTEGEEAWVPAVYHYMIRDKLISKAKTCNAHCYTHPRARGEHEHDVTAFLKMQKDWDLERDHGWNGIDVLYIFAKLDHETPRQGYQPKECRRGTVYGPSTLNNRMCRLRWENPCPPWTKRKGTNALREFVWNRMTTAAQNANSTRELRKLSKEEQKQVRKDSAGKHDANTGGWTRTKKGRNDSEEGFRAPVYIRAEGATKPASLKPRENKRSRPNVNLEYNEDKGHQHLSSASEQGRQTPTTKRQKLRESPPSAVYSQDTVPASQIDYRTLPPQNEQDARHIHRALAITRVDYLLRTGSECPPTARHQRYFHQVLELLNAFASH